MKNLYLAFVILSIGISVHTSKSAYAECPKWHKEIVEIPIVYEFKSERFRVEWVYNSLEPKLEIPGVDYLYSPHVSTIHEGRIMFTFCIVAEEIPVPNSKFLVNFGPRRLDVSARPVTWHDMEIVEHGKKIKVRRGKMSTVSFLIQQDPDWVIVRLGQWLVNTEGVPRLDIEVYNFTEDIHPGFNLELGLHDHAMRCKSEPRAQEISVSFEHSKEDIRVTSSDPGFKELIQREARLDIGACGELDFVTELGTTGILPRGDAFRLRYSFESKILTKKTGRSKDLQSIPDFEKIFNLPVRVINIHGERVFPRRITQLSSNR